MRGLTLRATLRLLGLGAMGYVAIIAVVIAVRLGPTARALRRHSERMLAEYDAMRARTLAFHATIEDIRSTPPATADSTRRRLATLRDRIDSLAAAASGSPALSDIPSEMRIEIAGSSVQQSRLGVALSEALANLELGHAGVAGRRLQVADSIAGILDRHLVEAQRLGLLDLIRRENALADATTASLRAIAWWLGLGIVLAPFVVVFLRRRFYDPLAALDRGLARVAQGDLEEMIPVLRPDELGRLSSHFNETTVMLRRRAEETRRRAQAALRESEERYQAIVEFAPLGIAVVDPEGRYLHANPALERFLGYTEAELRERRFGDVTLPADLALTTDLFREMLGGTRDRFQVDKRYVRKDGAVVWGRLMVAAVRDDAGKLVHTVSLIEDVTEERLRDAAARQVEERLGREQAALVELARHKAFTTGDVHAAWQELTEAAARTLEVDRVGVWLLDSDRTALRCDDLYTSSQDRHSEGVALALPRIPTYVRALDDNRVIAAPDVRTEPRVGELNGVYLAPLRITSLLAAPIRVGGRVAGVVCVEHVGTQRDWSPAAQSFAGSIADLAALALEAAERARTAVALRQSEEKFAIAFRSSPNPSIITRLEDGLLVDVNDAYLTTTGFARDEVIGRPAKEVLWPNPEGRDALVIALRAHGRVRGLELGMRTKGGPPLDVLVSIEAIELNGVPHTLGAAVDMTLQKRILEALRESEQRFRRLVQDLSVGVALLDGAGRVLLCNPAGLEMLGVTEQQLGVDGFWQRELTALHEDGTPYTQEERPVLNAVRTGTPLHNAVLGHRPGGQGEMRWANFNVDPQRDARGVVRNFIVSFSDVTERKRAAEALRESEERYRSLVESSPDAITVIQDGWVRYMNRAAATLIAARQPADVIGRSAFEFVADQWLAETQQRMDRILRGDRDTLGEVRLRRVDGAYVDVEALGIRLEFEGRPAVLVIHRDITDRHRQEEQLRLLAQAVKSTTEAISITDLEGRWTFANRAFLEKSGYTEEELLGHPVTLIDSPLNPPGLQEEIRAGTERGGWSGELYNRRKDGTDYLLALTTSPVKDPEGRVIALMGVSSDITERRRAEEEQRRLREAVMASAVDWTLTFDAVQAAIIIVGTDGRVRRLNAAARTLAGIDSYQDAVGRNPRALGAGEPWAGLAELAAEVCRTGAPASSQVLEEGARRSWYLTASPFMVSGEEDRVIVIARDVTDLVALQESLRRTETMSALGAVVAGVAHEVRNPLFAISGTVDAMEARFGQQQGYARYTDTLRQEVDRLSRLMGELLEYGKPPRLGPADTPLGPVIERAMASCAGVAEHAGVRLVAELPDDLPVLQLDSGRIQQVFHNLIENAIQHGPRGSEVTVRAAAVPSPQGVGIEVSVGDRGPGIRPQDLPQIFEPFFTKRRGGTGLGLSIVQRILEQHGGDITASNRDGGGALMTVRLCSAAPLATPDAPVDPVRAEA